MNPWPVALSELRRTWLAAGGRRRRHRGHRRPRARGDTGRAWSASRLGARAPTPSTWSWAAGEAPRSSSSRRSISSPRSSSSSRARSWPGSRPSRGWPGVAPLAFGDSYHGRPRGRHDRGLRHRRAVACPSSRGGSSGRPGKWWSGADVGSSSGTPSPPPTAFRLAAATCPRRTSTPTRAPSTSWSAGGLAVARRGTGRSWRRSRRCGRRTRCPTGHAEGVDRRRSAVGRRRRRPGVSAVVVRPRSVADAYRLRARYRAGETTAVFPAEVLVELYAPLGDVRDLLRLLTVLTQALVLLAIAPGRAGRPRPAAPSIGVLRALGRLPRVRLRRDVAAP